MHTIISSNLRSFILLITPTQKVQTKLESLDPSTRELIRGMLGQIDGKTDSFTDEETKGRTR